MLPWDLGPFPADAQTQDICWPLGDTPYLLDLILLLIFSSHPFSQNLGLQQINCASLKGDSVTASPKQKISAGSSQCGEYAPKIEVYSG